jgi:hypothetical protein
MRFTFADIFFGRKVKTMDEGLISDTEHPEKFVTKRFDSLFAPIPLSKCPQEGKLDLVGFGLFRAPEAPKAASLSYNGLFLGTSKPPRRFES